MAADALAWHRLPPRRRQNAPHIFRREEFTDRNSTGVNAEEAISFGLVVSKGIDKHSGLRWRRFDTSTLASAFINAHYGLVPPLLVFGERQFERPPAGEAIVDSFREKVRVTKGVRNSLSAKRVLVITRIACQRPAVTPRLSKKARLLGRATN